MISWFDPKKIPPKVRGCYFILFESNENKGTGIAIARFKQKEDFNKWHKPKTDIFVGIGAGNTNIRGGLLGDIKDNRYESCRLYTSKGISVNDVLFYSPLSELKMPHQQNINTLPNPLTDSIQLQKIDIKEIEERIEDYSDRIEELEQKAEQYNSLVSRLDSKVKNLPKEIKPDEKPFNLLQSEIIKLQNRQEYFETLVKKELQKQSDKYLNDMSANLKTYNNAFSMSHWATNDVKKLTERLDKAEKMYEVHQQTLQFIDLLQKTRKN